METCVWSVNKEDRMCGYCTLRQRCPGRVRRTENKARLVGDRYVSIIRDIAGVDPLEMTRHRPQVWCRNIIAYQMTLDGFTQEQIAGVIMRRRVTVVHCIRNMDAMLEAPDMYPWEYGVWDKFRKKLYSDNNT